MIENNLITKLLLNSSKWLNIDTKKNFNPISVINTQEISDANIKFVEMMNIKL